MIRCCNKCGTFNIDDSHECRPTTSADAKAVDESAAIDAASKHIPSEQNDRMWAFEEGWQAGRDWAKRVAFLTASGLPDANLDVMFNCKESTIERLKAIAKERDAYLGVLKYIGNCDYNEIGPDLIDRAEAVIAQYAESPPPTGCCRDCDAPLDVNNACSRRCNGGYPSPTNGGYDNE